MTSDTSENNSLDPKNWDSFREQAHTLLDACLDHLQHTRDQPWQPVPQTVRDSYALPDTGTGTDTASLVAALRDTMLPYATGNTHPRFFGWVHGSGMAEGVLAEMVAATMNSNCGGRDHGTDAPAPRRLHQGVSSGHGRSSRPGGFRERRGRGNRGTCRGRRSIVTRP